MRGAPLFAARAVLVWMLGAFGSSAGGAPITFELTFTPEYITIGGQQYPNQAGDGFSGPGGPFPSPQFSIMTASVVMDLNGQPQLGQAGTTLRMHDLNDPSIVTFSAVHPIDLVTFVLTPNFQPGVDRLHIMTGGPDSVRGPGSFMTDLFFPAPFDGNGTAIMPNSRLFQYGDAGFLNDVTYFMDSVTSVVVPEPAAAGSAAVMLALLVGRRRRFVRTQPR